MCECMCIHAWIKVVTASIFHLNGNVRNCGKKKLGSYNWLINLPGKPLISAGAS